MQLLIPSCEVTQKLSISKRPKRRAPSYRWQCR